jgi:hypothetical protein
MQAVFYAHIPGLKIGVSQSFAGGRLERLAFDDWAALESEYEDSQWKYDEAAPVFWVREFSVDDNWTTETLTHAVHDAVWPVHVAFLLDEKLPLIPTPALSSSYVVLPASTEYADVISRPTLRFRGALECEFIVYGSPLSYHYEAEELAVVEERSRFLAANGVQRRNGEVRAAIAVLDETARPDSWYVEDLKFDPLHGFVRCMAATESMLMSPETEGGKSDSITQTFGRRAAALLAPMLIDRDEGAKYFSDLYRFRSELMHGRTLPDRQDETVLARLDDGRQLLRRVICAAMALQAATPDVEPLGRVLSEAWGDPDKQRALAAIVAQGVQE